MNRYLTGHLPLISIFLFSLSLALYGQGFVITWLENNGVLSGMTQLLSVNELRLGLIVMLLLLSFMVFSALKIVADTINSLALLFFSKDENGALWQQMQGGAWIYFGASVLSLIAIKFIFVIILLFLIASFAYLLFVIYRIAESLTVPGLIGYVSFQLLFWSTFLFTVFYFAFRLYNTFVASLPL
ncbi:membrane protein [Bacillus sp. JCM 19046]|uniref:YufK family protein n=1 Tax=Shouchella xiaoxiensis TaxID=766895 RepID=A0ABS2SQZ5_9BACI|nr:DUF5366 family protein [Shouchella xiaoxiensis]MBM7837913.1 hypothetical protein [Shouchella xiaoxiensis]GAF12216.1 membrane protein [Bacillus sp. JCM 19045]GAF19139.1 membrane protein [Bacillus sp. JCM 19046]